MQLYLYDPLYLVALLKNNPRVLAAELQIAPAAQAVGDFFTSIRNLSALEGNAVSHAVH